MLKRNKILQCVRYVDMFVINSWVFRVVIFALCTLKTFVQILQENKSKLYETLKQLIKFQDTRTVCIKIMATGKKIEHLKSTNPSKKNESFHSFFPGFLSMK